VAPAFPFALPNVHPVRGVSVWDRVWHIDFIGSALSAGMWVAFSIAFVFAGGIWPWQDGRTIATIVVFVVLVPLYALQQYFCLFTTLETRSFPIHLLKSRTQILTAICAGGSFTAQYITTYFIPIYFQFVQSDTALDAAVRLLPFLLFLVFFNLLSGYLLPKVKYYVPIYLLSGICIILGGALMYIFLKPGTSTAHLYGISIVLAIGAGLSSQVGYAVATLKVQPADVANALSLQNVVQLGGATIALIIGVLVFQSAAVRNLNAVLAGQNHTQDEIKAAVAGAQSDIFDTIVGTLRGDAILAITRALQTTFILVIVAGAAITMSSIIMKWGKLFESETKPNEGDCQSSLED